MKPESRCGDAAKIYQDAPFCRKFTATVQSCTAQKGGFAVILNRTAFFPEGGGQPCDLGTLCAAGAEAVNVLAVHEQGEAGKAGAGGIVHTVDAPLPVGETVTGIIDWERRRDSMEQHSGEHILSGILHRMFGAENVGFHIGPDLVRMDLSCEVSPKGLAEAEAEANRIVRENLAVSVSYPSPEELAALTYRSKKELSGQVRIVEFPGADVCACCGTHVEYTGQVGLIKILTFQNYKGGTRLSVACGGRAFAALAAEHEVLAEAGRILSAPPLGVAEAVQHALDETAAQKAARVAAENRWFSALAATAKAGQPHILQVEEALSGDGLRRLCLACAEASGALTAAFCPAAAGGLSYALMQPGSDVRPICKALNAEFSGRGGGKPELCQGSLTGGEFEAVREFLARQQL